MTAPAAAPDVDAQPTTATGPTVRSSARRARGPVLVGLALLLVAVVTGLLSLSGGGGRLDPDSYAPGGSRALAELLRDRGVEVERVEAVQAVVDGARPDTTVVVPVPEALATSELEQLQGLASRLVLVGADAGALEALGLPDVVRATAPVDVDQRRPACALPAAEAAGEADLGGVTYEPRVTPAVGCYATSGRPSLLVLPAQGLVLLGDGTPLTNDRLDDRGNAALALGLLGETNRVVWLVPRPGRDVPGAQPPLSSLVADELRTGAVWLLVVVAVLALWRARRLGRVVEEPLPVVVRAAEAVEGRSRLYRASGARGSAAEALRAASRERVAHRVGLAASADRPALVEVVAERTGSDPARVDVLLYGDAPADDAALVRLAGDLRTLESALNP